MKKVELEVEERGEAKAKSLRREGYIPGILYGAGKKSVPFKILAHEFLHFLHFIHGEQVVVDLKFKGKKKKYLSILKDTQYDPVKDTVIHLDFQRVDTKTPIVIEIPFVFVGEPKGVKEGGVLEEIHRSVEVEALIQDIPEHIEVDVSELSIGNSIHIKDLRLPENIKILTHPEETIVTVLAPRVMEEEIKPVLPEEVEVAGREKEEEVEEGEEKEEKKREESE
ncbi:MAG: 50S ribosomal protein L25 [Caldiserica bacterium]|nr:50S ribosomal protein L25 [Caldisericota bacterium]